MRNGAGFDLRTVKRRRARYKLLVAPRRSLPNRRPRPLHLAAHDRVLSEEEQDHGSLRRDQALYLSLGGVPQRLNERVRGPGIFAAEVTVAPLRLVHEALREHLVFVEAGRRAVLQAKGDHLLLCAPLQTPYPGPKPHGVRSSEAAPPGPPASRQAPAALSPSAPQRPPANRRLGPDWQPRPRPYPGVPLARRLQALR